MPIYEYECEQCGVRFERLQRMTDASLKDCPECGGHIHRVMQPVGVIFKGSGFYVTDNRGKSSTGVPSRKKDDEGPAKSGSESAAGATTATSTAASDGGGASNSSSNSNSKSDNGGAKGAGGSSKSHD